MKHGYIRETEYKEYGGYLSFQMAAQKTDNGGVSKRQICGLNAGRYAIVAAAKDSGCKKVWVPVYMCPSVFEALERNGVEYGKYCVGHNLEPLLDALPADDFIVICNYFGCKGVRFYEKMVKKYKRVIFDHSQALFASPVLQEGVYNVYSPRKFVPVADGAFLISKIFRQTCIQIYGQQKDCSAGRSDFLMQSTEEGTNACYKRYLDNEEWISNAGVMRISLLSENLLRQFNYRAIRDARNKNIATLQNELKKREIQTPLEFDTDHSLMAYPLLISIRPDIVRKKLISRHIYVSQLWKAVLEDPAANEWEKTLSESLFPIPIDQRYTQEDMEYLAETICEIIEEAIEEPIKES